MTFGWLHDFVLLLKSNVGIADRSLLRQAMEGSTMFPDSWSANRIKIAVGAAYQNRTVIGNMWRGTTPSEGTRPQDNGLSNLLRRI